MQNFYPPSVVLPSAFAAPGQTYQSFVPPGPRHVPRNRAQHAVRLALHERMTRKPFIVKHATTAMWQRMTPPQRQVLPSVQLFDQEDLRWGEWVGDSALAIRDLTNECIRSANRAIFFKQTAKGWEATKLGHELIRIVQPLSAFATSYRCDLSFAPQIEMMLDGFKKVGLTDVSVDDPQMWLFTGASAEVYATAPIANLFNDLGDEVRSRGSSASAGREMERHAAMHAAKWREAKGYLAKIAKRYPACHIKRFELQPPESDMVDRDALFRRMHEASGVFVRSVKLMYGNAIVGDARLIDGTSGNGYQAHVLLALDGPTAEELAQIDEALANLWREQARGGDLRDVNAMPMFQYRGSGRLYLDYETPAGQLEKAAIYLARTSEILEVRCAGGPAGLVIGETSNETKARDKLRRN